MNNILIFSCGFDSDLLKKKFKGIYFIIFLNLILLGIDIHLNGYSFLYIIFVLGLVLSIFVNMVFIFYYGVVVKEYEEKLDNYIYNSELYFSKMLKPINDYISKSYTINFIFLIIFFLYIIIRIIF